MNTTTKVVQQAQKTAGNYPAKKFRAGGVSATIWVNKGNANGKETEYNTISLERVYTDKEGNWQTTSTFRVGDLPKINALVQRAYESLIVQEQDLFKGGN